jgi:hypothetical protein
MFWDEMMTMMMMDNWYGMNGLLEMWVGDWGLVGVQKKEMEMEGKERYENGSWEICVVYAVVEGWSIGFDILIS